MLEALNKKQKIIFLCILFFMIIFIIYYIYSNLYNSDINLNSDTNTFINNNFVENELSSNNNFLDNFSKNSIVVYICGCVKENKVITLKEGSRISDAIDSVGGLTTEADLTNINLAYILEDGEKIYIPKKGEDLTDNSSSSSFVSNNEKINSSSSLQNQKVNINKASQTELETIPGIGPSIALQIIDYRNKNGKFNSTEDIKNVSGIGDAKYEKMKEYISIK